MRSYVWAVWGACAVIAAALALAAALRPLVAAPSLQEQVLSIAADVRCPECQGESAAESNAAASLAIRAEIARDLEAGQGRSRILREIAAQYGEWILYRPPVRGAFLLLWGTPFVALAGVGVVLLRTLRSAPRRAPDPAAAAGVDPPREELSRRLARFL